MKKLAILAAAALLMFTASACSQQPQQTQPANAVQEETQMQTTTQKQLGAMTPQQALDYMKATPNLVIVDVATAGRYESQHFAGAINIPIEEISRQQADEAYKKIPAGQPVLLHCRLGMIVPGAYRRVLELRSDIPEIGYIDGRPPFDAYNELLEAQK